MIVELENRKYTVKANGSFMKKYQETFNENMMIALYKCSQEKDVYTCAKLTYCAINEEMPFDEWIDSFETPLFMLASMDKILEYLIRSVEPTVKAENNATEEEGDTPKKKEN